MKHYLSLMFALVMSLTALAQTSLKGRVIDEATQQPVVGAKVTLANQNISTTTNASGEFSLLYLEAIDEEMVIEADGAPHFTDQGLTRDGERDAILNSLGLQILHFTDHQIDTEFDAVCAAIDAAITARKR